MKKSKKEEDVLVDTIGATDQQKEETTTTNNSKPTGEDSSLLRVLMTVKRSLESIPINEIKRFTLFPDFVTPTTAEHPVIVRTPLENDCIDGWNLIEEALADGETEIVCEVDEVEVHSVAENCLRKAGMRSLTRGGKYIYPEMVRNTKILMNHLMSSGDELRIYGHGGRRFGEGFINNRENDVIYLLSLRLGKDDTTIKNYRCHSEYLSDDVLDTLIKRKATKEFFEDFQTKKRIEVKNELGSGNLSVNRITEMISKLILEEFEQFLIEQENKKAKKGKSPETPIIATPDATEEGEPTDDDDDDGDEQENPIAVDIIPGSSDPTPVNNEAPVTFETIKLQIINVSKRIVDDVSKEISLDDMRKRLQEEVLTITKILAQIEAQIEALSGEKK